MKQQFEVGDKALTTVAHSWKLGETYPAGTEVTVSAVDHDDIRCPYWVEFPNGKHLWEEKLDPLPTTTGIPTTIVTVHGNENWKPEKGEQIGWKIIKWFPINPTYKSDMEECFQYNGYHLSVKDLAIKELTPFAYPDFFAPVYKEAKPIEFVKGVNIINETLEVLGCMPPEAKTIHLLCKDYRETGWDLMFVEFDGTAPLLYLGHFNSGTI